jgi:hypothetical protein
MTNDDCKHQCGTWHKHWVLVIAGNSQRLVLFLQQTLLVYDDESSDDVDDDVELMKQWRHTLDAETEVDNSWRCAWHRVDGRALVATRVREVGHVDDQLLTVASEAILLRHHCVQSWPRHDWCRTETRTRVNVGRSLSCYCFLHNSELKRITSIAAAIRER